MAKVKRTFPVESAAWWLVVLGGINWGFVGLGNLLGGGNWNLIQNLLNFQRGAADLVYILAGAGALILVCKRVSN